MDELFGQRVGILAIVICRVKIGLELASTIRGKRALLAKGRLIKEISVIRKIRSYDIGRDSSISKVEVCVNVVAFRVFPLHYLMRRTSYGSL